MILRFGKPAKSWATEQDRRITGDEYRSNLAAKLDHPGFAKDCAPLLRPGTVFDPVADARLVDERILSLLPTPNAAVSNDHGADKRRAP